MPKTNVVHAIYGPYGPTGQGGIYTFMFGDPGEPFPRDLPADADERSKALNEKAKAYWEGKEGKGGHVFLVTPKEMKEAIKQMEKAGMNVLIARKKLEEFEKKQTSPFVRPHEPSRIAQDAVNLGTVPLSSVDLSKITDGKGR